MLPGNDRMLHAVVYAVAWDLDSTLSSSVHRRHLIPEIRAGRATWDDYSMLAGGDTPVEGTTELMRFIRFLNPAVQHVIISGRSEAARDLTWDWLASYGVPVDRLMLRPAGDDTPNGEWKVRCLDQLHAEGIRVCLYVGDWAPVAAYVREKTGIRVLGVNPLDEGAILVTQEMLAEKLAAHDAYARANWVEPEKLAADVFAGLGGAH